MLNAECRMTHSAHIVHRALRIVHCAAFAARTASGPEGMRRTRRCAGSVLPRTLAGPARDGSLRPGSPGTAPRGASVLLRKEVIQPRGLAQRLWVQTAFMM